MASKMEYLQRYMSGSGGDSTDAEKKRKKKTKKSKKVSALGTRVVDADEAWEQSAPSREDIDNKWEMDAAEDEKPQVVVADGGEMVDPQDLPVYVDSERYLDEFQGRKDKQKADDDVNLSPPRKKTARRGDSREATPPRNEDSSPPRRRVDAAKRVARRRRGDSEDDGGDVSPPRRGRQRRGGEASPPRRARDDASPPRRQSMKQAETRGRRSGDEDASPPRRGRADSSRGRRGGDASPSHRNSGKAQASRLARDEDASQDASPARRSRRGEVDSNRDERKRSSSRSLIAPERQRRVDSLGRDIPLPTETSERRSSSSPRRDDPSNRRRHRSSSRSTSRTRARIHGRARRRERPSRSRSPRSRRRGSRSPSARRQRSLRKTTRWAPPERREPARERSRSRERRRSPSRRSRSRSSSPKLHSSESSALKTLQGEPRESLNSDKRSGDAKEMKKESKTKAHEGKEEKKAGLFTPDEFEQHRNLAAKRKDMLHGVDAAEMGAKAETVYRDKRGRKLDMLNEMVRQQEVLDGKRKREEREEYEWGTGEVQKRERKTQQEILEQMKKMPFARHDDDEELERKRRERVRAFDPINSKVFQEDPLAEGKSTKKKKKSKDKKNVTKAKPKYAGPPAPPNRFGIMPGYRWDGVVRGTNWEEKTMMRQNATTALSEEAYKYAVADM